MLRIVKANEVPFELVKNLYNSYTNKNELAYALYCVKNGEKIYLQEATSKYAEVYYLIDSSLPNYLIGYGTIDDSEINHHSRYINTGQISYNIRECERNKGYGTRLLKLIIKECESRGMKEVCISCSKKNLASKKVILRNHGEFEKEFHNFIEGDCLKFWIKLNPTPTNRIRHVYNIESMMIR